MSGLVMPGLVEWGGVPLLKIRPAWFMQLLSSLLGVGSFLFALLLVLQL
jgi:hypothetical protein